VARSAKIIQSLQLRVQLRNLTGFPLDTINRITISAAKIRQKYIQEQIFYEQLSENFKTLVVK